MIMKTLFNISLVISTFSMVWGLNSYLASGNTNALLGALACSVAMFVSGTGKFLFLWMDSIDSTGEDWVPNLNELEDIEDGKS